MRLATLIGVALLFNCYAAVAYGLSNENDATFETYFRFSEDSQAFAEIYDTCPPSLSCLVMLQNYYTQAENEDSERLDFLQEKIEESSAGGRFVKEFYGPLDTQWVKFKNTYQAYSLPYTPTDRELILQSANAWFENLKLEPVGFSLLIEIAITLNDQVLLRKALEFASFRGTDGGCIQDAINKAFASMSRDADYKQLFKLLIPAYALCTPDAKGLSAGLSESVRRQVAGYNHNAIANYLTILSQYNQPLTPDALLSAFKTVFLYSNASAKLQAVMSLCAAYNSKEDLHFSLNQKTALFESILQCQDDVLCGFFESQSWFTPHKEAAFSNMLRCNTPESIAFVANELKKRNYNESSSFDELINGYREISETLINGADLTCFKVSDVVARLQVMADTKAREDQIRQQNEEFAAAMQVDLERRQAIEAAARAAAETQVIPPTAAPRMTATTNEPAHVLSAQEMRERRLLAMLNRNNPIG